MSPIVNATNNLEQFSDQLESLAKQRTALENALENARTDRKKALKTFMPFLAAVAKGHLELTLNPHTKEKSVLAMHFRGEHEFDEVWKLVEESGLVSTWRGSWGIKGRTDEKYPMMKLSTYIPGRFVPGQTIGDNPGREVEKVFSIEPSQEEFLKGLFDTKPKAKESWDALVKSMSVEKSTLEALEESKINQSKIIKLVGRDITHLLDAITRDGRTVRNPNFIDGARFHLRTPDKTNETFESEPLHMYNKNTGTDEWVDNLKRAGIKSTVIGGFRNGFDEAISIDPAQPHFLAKIIAAKGALIKKGSDGPSR